ncbi:MAG: hypothetical protein WCD70_04710 [Alphaproteobacteria bacterium]
MTITDEEFDKMRAFTLANNAMILNFLLLLREKQMISKNDINNFADASKSVFSKLQDPIMKEVIQRIEEMRDVALTT